MVEEEARRKRRRKIHSSNDLVIRIPVLARQLRNFRAPRVKAQQRRMKKNSWNSSCQAIRIPLHGHSIYSRENARVNQSWHACTIFLTTFRKSPNPFFNRGAILDSVFPLSRVDEQTVREATWDAGSRLEIRDVV